MKDIDIHEAVVAAAGSGRPIVLATVLDTKGSVPRHAGSRMIIDEHGLIGTIGGGCGEADVIGAAREVSEDGVSRIVQVELTDAITSWSPAVCGGVMKILLERVV